ncbi:MAG: hypothetical protein PHV06_06760 [bacterium]|mgnify:CR=1 FL=1|nr:hypothetical protein [bacterium]
MRKFLFVLFACLILSSAFAVNTDWGFITLIQRSSYFVLEEGDHSFSLMNARFLAGGDIVKDLVSVAFQAELDSDAVNILDAKGIYKMNPFQITVGRFLAPYDYYTPQSFAKLDLIEYPILEAYSPFRQEGIMLSYKNDLISSHLMVSNGSGKNSYDDTDKEKAYLLRLDLTPFKGFTVGGSCWYEKYGVDGFYKDSNRANFMFNYKNKLFFFNNQASYIEEEDAADANIYSYAYFSHLTFFLGEKLELLSRYEFTNVNTQVTGGLQTRFTFGVNYNIQGPKAQIAFNYQVNGESEEAKIDNDKAILMFMFIL